MVGCVDYRDGALGKTYTHGGRRAVERAAVDQARALADAGAGEIILQSIDRDGLRTGMDLDAVRGVGASLKVPLVALGGAGDVGHLEEALASGAAAAASGSAFSFIGRLRAVLINYPSARAVDAVRI